MTQGTSNNKQIYEGGVCVDVGLLKWQSSGLEAADTQVKGLNMIFLKWSPASKGLDKFQAKQVISVLWIQVLLLPD